METLTNYKEIVKNALAEIAAKIPSDENVEVETIFDDTRGHYLLFTVGWYNNTREYAALLHIDVKANGKVYIQHDGTDLEFALRLTEKGIFGISYCYCLPFSFTTKIFIPICSIIVFHKCKKIPFPFHLSQLAK